MGRGDVERVTGQLVDKVPRASAARGDKWEVDLSLHPVAQFNLRGLRGFLQALESQRRKRQVDAVAIKKSFHQKTDDHLVEIIPPQMAVPVGRTDLKNHRFGCLLYP